LVAAPFGPNNFIAGKILFVPFRLAFQVLSSINHEEGAWRGQEPFVIHGNFTMKLEIKIISTQLATPIITYLIQLNFSVPRNSRTRTLQFPFQIHILQLKIRNTSRELEAGNLTKTTNPTSRVPTPGLLLVQLLPHLSTNSYRCERTHLMYSSVLSPAYGNQKEQTLPYYVYSVE